jgi:hypothetical protein
MSNNTTTTPVSNDVTAENVPAAGLSDVMQKAQAHADAAKGAEATQAAALLTGDSAGAQVLIEALNGNPQALANLLASMTAQHSAVVAREDTVKHQWALDIAQDAVNQFMIDKVDANGSLGIRAQVQGMVVEPDGSEENWTVSISLKRTSSIRRANKPVLRSQAAASRTTVTSSVGMPTITDILRTK